MRHADAMHIINFNKFKARYLELWLGTFTWITVIGENTVTITEGNLTKFQLDRKSVV